MKIILESLATNETLILVTSDGRFIIRNPSNNEIDERIFYPGEFDAIKEHAPQYEDLAKEIWTPEIIEAWYQNQDETQKIGVGLLRT